MTFAFLLDSVPFSKAVRDGQTSLGGSESACLGLARALHKRGHVVHCFATKLAEDAAGPDAAGVLWHPAEAFHQINQWIEWDVVVALRQPWWFSEPIHARLRLLWNQDLLMPGVGATIMAIAWALDGCVYVSDYHRRQWETQQPELAPLAWVTKNGFDPALVPATATKDPNRLIYISRPERGLLPLLAMWPTLRAANPHATLQICRYASMYDGEGSNVRAMVDSYDAQLKDVQQTVGGLEYLGQLTKPQLYQAIAEAAVMWYPGVHDFAETSCVAAIEAQACGTPFVGSFKGPLPETIPSGMLIPGDAMTPAYQADSLAAVTRFMDGCRTSSFAYRKTVQAGREHAKAYTFDVIATEWETELERRFTARYETHKPRILERLLHDDNHCAAKVVAKEIADTYVREHGIPDHPDHPASEGGSPASREYVAAVDAAWFCDRVIAGQDQVADDYAAFAIQDPLKEVEISARFKVTRPFFKDCTRVLDVACGNGAFAIGLAMAYPHIRVHGMDYAAANIKMAREAAERAGVGDRCIFEARTVYDFDTQQMHGEWHSFVAMTNEESLDGPLRFDGLFVGEFVEHVASCTALVDGLEAVLKDGALVLYTCPLGPFTELLPRGTPVHRGHVHCFTYDDVKAVWGGKLKSAADFFSIGVTPRGAPIGHWIIHYTTAPNRPAGTLDFANRARRTRPLAKLSVGLIVHNGELDLAKCLDSIWQIADEIVVGDTGSTDDTRAIAEKFGARVIDLDPVSAQPDGFSGARNAVLAACTGDWFLWIDSDETLVGAHHLRLYLDGPVFHGYVIHQNHFYLDGPSTFDIPVRLFRTGRGVQFYGCVHEQPQEGEANADIYPTLNPGNLQIVHTGYLTSDQREWKRVNRNLPLLVRDAQRFPERLLGKVLLLREAVIQANAEVSQAGVLTDGAAGGYAFAVKTFLDLFGDPAHKYHQIARGWYETALQALGVGWEMEIALAGKAGPLKGTHAKPERIWVQSHAEFAAILQYKVDQMKKGMVREAVHTDPFPLPTAREEVPA